ncbi:MAG: BatD family protein, partial [Candidatus Symbiothrix sp.]|nr:BatD family protein [Candidatus Symbiothrix sp.]
MRKLIFLLILCLSGTFTLFSQNISFKGITEKTVVVNQQFRVNYILTTGGEHGKDIRMPEVKGLDVLFGHTLSGQSSSTTIVNGNASTQLTLTYTYVLMSKEAGTYTIPPATIKVGNSEYKSNEITVKVLPPDQANAAAPAAQNDREGSDSRTGSSTGIENSDLFVRMHVSKSSVYENENFLVTFKLYSLVDITGFDNIKYPEFEGFIAQEIELPSNNQLSLENYNGHNYRTIVLKQTVLYPQRPGKITIGSGKFDANIRVRSQRKSRSFFDDFFDNYQNVKKTLASAPVTVDVKALPSGKPASFTGAVGDYKMMSSISSSNIKANDAVTIKVTLSGNGNIKLVKNPEIVFPVDFDVFDPKVDVSARILTSGVTGNKTVEYYAIPRYAGDFTIPKAQFSYFDLKSGTYKTLSTEEYHLHVEPGEGGGGNSPTIVNSSNKEDIRYLGQDVRHIKTGDFSFHKKDFLFGSLTYWLAYIIPSILFILFFIYFRKLVKQNANIALMRTRKANKVATKRLKTANSYLKEDQREAFYDEILKAVWGYLSDKLSIPVSSLTKDNVEA